MLHRFENMTDEQLAAQAKKDETALEYLIEKYKNFVLSKSRPYFLIGADKEDLIQEGMIGLYKAIIDYDKSKNASFRTFANLCVTRQIITAVKTSTRQKHIPLNSYLSLDKPIFDEDTDVTVGESMMSELYIEPEERVILKEDVKSIREAIDTQLTDMEKRALKLYLDGKSYKEISEALGKVPKSIDNALQRVKKKLEHHLSGE
ncbi:MAG: RNA polymerase sporulation sigma factor SigH [Clostridia bacterium]|nr:RNA polymerase sporulation sigma factor SigH [Clostridia bacterium]